MCGLFLNALNVMLCNAINAFVSFVSVKTLAAVAFTLIVKNLSLL
uniref:Uncharacterized protein n=1 Tax=Anguilla anguilla TaxID=7936 RepID=A0A0E9RML2_ANGAN